MTFNYSPLKATAERLIARFGKDAVLRQAVISGPLDDPIISNSDTTIKVASFDDAERNPDGSRTGETVKVLYVSTGAGLTPTEDDKIAVSVRGLTAVDVGPETIFLEVGKVMALNPGDTVLFFEVTVKT